MLVQHLLGETIMMRNDVETMVVSNAVSTTEGPQAFQAPTSASSASAHPPPPSNATSPSLGLQAFHAAKNRGGVYFSFLSCSMVCYFYFAFITIYYIEASGNNFVSVGVQSVRVGARRINS